MKTSAGQKCILLAIVILAAAFFFTGIGWGLPSRSTTDPFLFGSRVPWTGQEIMSLAGAWDISTPRGADIAMHPLGLRNQPIVLNDTDAKRAEIVRRYRLYSNQPDEMITFRSLSRMKPGKLDLDPAMYQYGGLWIYPVGALLKLAAMLHLIELRGDLAFYLDHPEAFGRFYLVARCYSAGWGLIGVLAVFAVGRELSGKFFVGAGSGAVYACLPVVIDLAHEAKPHLAGSVLTLLAAWAAMRFVRTGQQRWWMSAAGFAGASMGIVLTGYVAFAAIGVMPLLRSMPWKRRVQTTLSAGLIAFAVFAITNPYLLLNVLFHRQVLHSNVGNYGTFYHPGLSIGSVKVVCRSLWEGCSPWPLLIGLAGIIGLLVQRNKSALVLFAVGLVVGMQFLLLADGKTAEYARFALTLDIILAIAAVAAIDGLRISPREKTLAGILLAAATLFFSLRYELNFIVDSSHSSTRLEAARAIGRDSQNSTLAVWAEPAPYCLPPVNVFDWRMVLEPAGSENQLLPPGTLGVRPVDDPGSSVSVVTARVSSPISWANKPFAITRSVSPSATRP